MEEDISSPTATWEHLLCPIGSFASLKEHLGALWAVRSPFLIQVVVGGGAYGRSQRMAVGSIAIDAHGKLGIRAEG